MPTRLSLIGLLLMLLALFIAVPLSARAQSWTLMEVASLWPTDVAADDHHYRVTNGLTLSFTEAEDGGMLPMSRRSRVLFARRDGRTILDMGYWPTSLELGGGVSPYSFTGEGRLGLQADPSGMMLELADGESGVTSYFGAGYREIGLSDGGLPRDDWERVGFYAVAGFRVAVDHNVDFFTDYRFSTAMTLPLGMEGTMGPGEESAVDTRASAIMGGFRISF